MKDLTLVLDFSAALSVGLVDDLDRTLAFRIREQGTRGESAHALLDECLAEAGRGIGDLASLCVGVGPGSFTGIRVCAALSQGLAFADRLPIFPFSSLAGLLSGLPAVTAPRGIPSPAVVITGVTATAASPAIAVIAANGGRYFARRSDTGAEDLLTHEGLLALGSPATVLITAGNVPDRERLRPAFAALERHEDRADFPALARLARSRPPITDGVLRPNYLMASAAEEKRLSGDAPK
ncbi:MAG: tRNA (adenosine(37)-N6)-threonylcarbamoyltransferase complex dimerization subunit type 1 TsaB [Fibrobacteria bacterium]